MVRAIRFSVASQYRRNAYLAFVGPDGREVFRAPAAYWDSSQLEVLCERAQLPVEGSYYDVVSVFGMNRRVPGSARWGRSIAIVVVLMAVVIGIMIVLDGPSSR